jgi:hypothetical protein
VLAAARGRGAGDRIRRLWASTLPATVTALPSQPGFAGAKVRALPGRRLTEFGQQAPVRC